MEHRTVRRGTATKVVTLHHALEALAAADADHVDALAVGEDTVDEHLIAGFRRFSALRNLDLATHASRRHASLLVMAGKRLAHARRTALDETELHRLVAVVVRRLRLHHDARPGLNDRARYGGAVR